MSFELFIDFDGTIATVDVGNRFFTTFCGGKNHELVERWIRREVTSIECLKGEAALITASRSELVDFSHQFEIDDGFHRIHEICNEYEIPIRIVSDGLNIYIEEIMKKYGYADIPVYANEAVFENGRVDVRFPHIDYSCGHCGNCKGGAIHTLLSPGNESIFVGDGYSDLCAIGEADYLFAKGDLADYLRRNNGTFLPFKTLHEVAEQMIEILRNSSITARSNICGKDLSK